MPTNKPNKQFATKTDTMQHNKKLNQGLYRPDYEHDACGVGMIVNIHGNKSHELVDAALKVIKPAMAGELSEEQYLDSDDDGMYAGMVLLLGLMAFVMLNDIIRIVTG